MSAREAGSAVAEFVMVGVLLTITTLAVLQLALALLVRNTVQDAASEGARYGALVGNSPADAAIRTAELIRTAVGDQYADDVDASLGNHLGSPVIVVTVRATLPVLGLLGPTNGIEVSGHAPL
jgi:Flp pilus assembly protein TadG